jgi:hypothetical protein
MQTLSWESAYDNTDGTVDEFDRPFEYPLLDGFHRLPQLLTHQYWLQISQALKSPLFETPVVHFFVSAYQSNGMDEFLAHITTIEAALGLRGDYSRNERPPQYEKLGATSIVSARVKGLLGSDKAADTYKKLFDIRSTFLHGRPVDVISTKRRVDAHRLAKEIVCALIKAATSGTAIRNREEHLWTLYDLGKQSTH